MSEVRICIVCGNEYTPARQDQSTCGNKQCVRDAGSVRKRERKLERKFKASVRKRGNREKIIDIDACAQKEGLSYGHYVAKYGI